MTRSIFDPTGGETERSGTTFTPPDADQISQLPPSYQNPPEEPATGDVDFSAPAEDLPVSITPEGDGKILNVKLSGTLQKSDYDQFLPMVVAAIARYGKIRLLIELHHFHGWSAGALWEDVKFDATHFNDIERLAIVGETKWEKVMAAFCRPFTTAAIRYFQQEQESDARAWIAQTA